MPNDLKILKYYLWDQLFLKHQIKQMVSLPEHQHASNAITVFMNKQNEIKLDELSHTTFTIFDLETTGFFPHMGDEIISIGAIKVRNNQILFDESFYTIIKPLNKIPKQIVELTGLSPNLLNHADSFPIGVKKFIDYCQNSVLVAHPATFDIDFLSTSMKQWQLPNFQPVYIDSHQLANLVFPDERNYLDELVDRLEINERDRHHALNDAIMTAEIFVKLLHFFPKDWLQTSNMLKNI
ncbi:PolC-type DNA polymerase III [Bacillus weihaiensis]|uniref:Exonuclease domain-containing protein n=1 Tax=Bacillus weihaiensis TaxID=1547283 RepID=A0A1L3MRC3_9BACI|nr:3'-5' exonuclease [Bacillus weihaiensis]APH04804.1 hypothetical protein A9C19_08615 [Bacillus weihaiensis]